MSEGERVTLEIVGQLLLYKCNRIMRTSNTLGIKKNARNKNKENLIVLIRTCKNKLSDAHFRSNTMMKRTELKRERLVTTVLTCVEQE